jgi:hypothetical protein
MPRRLRHSLSEGKRTLLKHAQALSLCLSAHSYDLYFGFVNVVDDDDEQ